MRPADLINYINNPGALDKASVQELQKLVADFPYFQSAHVLLSIASRKWDASIYQQSLKKTAIVSTNRAHLFKLIHAIENEGVAEETKKAEPIDAPESVATVDLHQEDSRQELAILKAAEISSETGDVQESEALTDSKAEEREQITETKVKPVLNAEQILEREIGKEVVNSFVEKEVLKTPEATRPPVKPENPESFSDWLSFLKKNNGQSYEQIKEQVNFERAKQNPADNGIKQETLKPVSVAPEEKKKEGEGDPEVQTRKLKNKAIIDKIIESSPGIIRQKEEQRFYAPDIKAKESLLENEHLVTETLAKIYALQGSISKAIRAYEILSLKSPQKRAYYDGLIQKLKSNG